MRITVSPAKQNYYTNQARAGGTWLMPIGTSSIQEGAAPGLLYWKTVRI